MVKTLIEVADSSVMMKTFDHLLLKKNTIILLVYLKNKNTTD